MRNQNDSKQGNQHGAEQGDTVFKALADRQRRAMLRLLRAGELPAGDISTGLDLSPATVSHHLSRLKTANLVRVRREGQQRIYALNTSVVEDVMLMFTDLFKENKGDMK